MKGGFILTQENSKEQENFTIVYPSKDTILVTSESDINQKFIQEYLDRSIASFRNGSNYTGTYYKEVTNSNNGLDDTEYNKLAETAQIDINSVLRINSLARHYINKDEIIGKVYETIENNTKGNIKVSFDNLDLDELEKDELLLLKEMKKKFANFNKQIKLTRFIKSSIPNTYAEGNYLSYLMGDSRKGYSILFIPLNIIAISDYLIDDSPLIYMDMDKLTSSLQKTLIISKKTKKAINLKLEEEIKKIFPPEVYKGFLDKEKYVPLNHKRTGVIRINNMNKKYGLSPIFRTFRAADMLETYKQADKTNTKAKAKKIIFQKLDIKVMGDNANQDRFDLLMYAHNELMQAWRNPTVIYTGAPFVSELKYVEPTVETNNTEEIQSYRNEIMTSLGIGFLNNENKQTFTVANITVEELMKTIDKIASQVEDVIEKWYQVFAEEEGIDEEYIPTVEILDAELISTELKIKLVEVLYNKLNLSYQTSLELLGLSLEEEVARRAYENNQGIDKIMYPRANAYNSSGDNVDNKGGRPVDNNDPDKQLEDQDRRNTE